MALPAADPRFSSSPITQVQLSSAAPQAEAPHFSGGAAHGKENRSFLLSLCQRVCCGRGDAAADREVAQPLASKPVYVPAAPHAGRPFLPPPQERDYGKKTLVLDLDETLVHSSFKSVPNPDYVIPVEIDGKITDVYVLKRPFVDQFLADVGARFEVVVFTASLAKYADPLIDLLDVGRVVRWRLFRDACYPYEGNYVKDLTCLGRDLRRTIIVDNSPHSYIFQPFNAVPVRNFIDDKTERDLLELIAADGPLRRLERADDVTVVCGEMFLPGCYALPC